MSDKIKRMLKKEIQQIYKYSGPRAFHVRPAALMPVRYSKTLPVS